MYNHREIDQKWQNKWDESQVFRALDPSQTDKDPFYCLIEFPFPSGAGLHVGHPRSYTALDVVARKRRAEGFNVLYPIGWDAFGLPTENYAIKTGRPPAEVTAENIATFKRQIKSLGLSFDWSREVNTTDPAYYKWTQWMFLEMFKAGLAYKAKIAINWCPKDKIGLANEEVINGCCERCGNPVEKRDKEQWIIAITKYADRLLEDLNTVNYLPRVKKQQEDWIGRSEGAEIDFTVEQTGEKLTVFTTRPDTLFGVTFLAVSPDHPVLDQVVPADHKDAVEAFRAEARKTQLADTGTEDGADKEKNGVFTGAFVINPANGERVPLWVGDYVLMTYGTGAVMGVPAHDERDFAFAKKYGIAIKQVIDPVRDRLRATGALLKTQDGKYIFQERDENAPTMAGQFTTFGGGFDAQDVDGFSCIIRELQEETELTCKREDIQFIGIVPSSNSPDKYNIAYLINGVDPGAITVHEGKGFVVLTEEEVLNHARSTPFMRSAYLMAAGQKVGAFTEDGKLINSGNFTGQSSEEARAAITTWLSEKGVGRPRVTYRLRDWVFSRQRYWGEPIPLVHCESGCGAEHDGWVPLPESALPLTLPTIENYQPTDNGESPLASATDWVNTSCPQCGGPAKRETDTMPNWAGSSWYFLRYIDPNNDEQFASKEKLDYWMPVNWYNGGMEHTTLHLLYSRFWHKFLFDRGYVNTPEPYARRTSHGLIMAEDGTKMSKSKGNVVNPEDIVGEYGADTMRVYELFIGPFSEAVPWTTSGVIGVRRFLDRAAKIHDFVTAEEPVEISKAVAKTIHVVAQAVEDMKFNTAVASLMSCVNEIASAKSITKETLTKFLAVFGWFAPHVANEINAAMGGTELTDTFPLPEIDHALLTDDTMTISVQVNGKLRATIDVKTDAPEEEIVAAAKAHENVVKYVTGEPKKVIYIKGKIVSIVV